MEGFFFFDYLCINYYQMINSVRNTVLAIANKQNFGYISPADFNLYAKQAQLDIFENYFYRYNEWLAKQNGRVSGSQYADIVKNLEEVIDTFSVEDALVNNNTNVYNTPNETNNSNTYYLLNKVLIYHQEISSGEVSTFTGTTFTDSSADFVTDGVAVGDLLSIIEGGVVNYVTITAITSATQLEVSSTFALSAARPLYSILRAGFKEAERVSHSKITMLNSSNLTAPKLNTPAYTQSEGTISLYPETIDGSGQVRAQYIRKPKDPKWTYSSLAAGEPIFDQGAADYQDFELPASDEPTLVSKILKYVGISIREADLYQAGTSEELKETQKQG
jgi:hypothetical protein